MSRDIKRAMDKGTFLLTCEGNGLSGMVTWGIALLTKNLYKQELDMAMISEKKLSSISLGAHRTT